MTFSTSPEIRIVRDVPGNKDQIEPFSGPAVVKHRFKNVQKTASLRGRNMRVKLEMKIGQVQDVHRTRVFASISDRSQEWGRWRWRENDDARCTPRRRTARAIPDRFRSSGHRRISVPTDPISGRAWKGWEMTGTLRSSLGFVLERKDKRSNSVFGPRLISRCS